MKKNILIILVVLVSVFFLLYGYGCKKIKNESSLNYNGEMGIPDSDLAAWDSVGVPDSLKFSDLVFDDDTNMLSWAEANDSSFLNKYYRTTATTNSLQNELKILIYRCGLTGTYLTDHSNFNFPNQPNGIAYVWASSQYQNPSICQNTTGVQCVCESPLNGVDCDGFIYQLFNNVRCNLKIPFTTTTGYIDTALWNKALRASTDYNGLLVVDVTSSVTGLLDGDIIDAPGRHIGIILHDNNGNIAIFNSLGKWDKTCSENLNSKHGAIQTPYTSYWLNKLFGTNYHVLRFTNPTATTTTGTWTSVGNAGFSAGGTVYLSIAIDQSGTPYVAYADYVNGKNGYAGATVMKFNGSNWSTVGSPGFSAGAAFNNSIAIDKSGTPYVAYVDITYGNSGGPATVMKYNGSSWVNVGNAGFSQQSSSTSSETAVYTSIAIDGNGTPYVVYEDDTDGAFYGPATVMKFNGSNWVPVGNIGFSAGSVYSTSIAIDGNGIPYVLYADNANGNKATVMKFSGGNWVTVGSAGFSSGNGFIGGEDGKYFSAIAIDGNGTPYVAYDDPSLGVSVMKYNGSNWVTVGNFGGSTTFVSLAIDANNTPYLACSGNTATTVRRYNGTSWIVVGNAGFTPAGANEISIAINNAGVPYVLYQDLNNNTFPSYIPASVMKYGK